MIRKLLVAISFFVLSMVSTSYAGGGTWNGWIYQDPYPTSLNLFDVKFVTPNKGWLTGKYGSIFYTEDGGDTWEAQETGLEEDIMRIAFVNDKAGWAVGKKGTIIHTADGGKTWVKQYNANALLTKVFFIDEKEGWVTGATPQAVVLHTKDGGKMWEEVETGISRAISSVFFINSQTGWILAGDNVCRTIDGGKKWEKRDLPDAKFPTSGITPQGFIGSPTIRELGAEWWYGDIAFINEKQGWAVVNLEKIYYTSDGGKTWTAQLNTGPGSYSFAHVSFRDAQNGCVSGSTVYCTEDGGKRWKEQLEITPGHGRNFGGISLSGSSAGWVVGNDGQILKTQNKGKEWKSAATKNECGGELYVINGKTRWHYGNWESNADKLCMTDDGGKTWKEEKIGISVNRLFFLNASNGWAAGRIEEWKGGKKTHNAADRIRAWAVIKHTTDGGKTWANQYHEEIAGRDFSNGLWGIYFENDSTGWIVGEQGIILHTKDGGRHWKRQESLSTTYSLFDVYFIDKKEGWITGYKFEDMSGAWTGLILHTSDGGNRWELQHTVSDVSFGDMYFVDKKSIWVSGDTESGQIGILLHTEDGGKTWEERESDNIGSNAMTFLDNNRGVISGGTGVMAITTDGGKTWTKRHKPLKKYPWHVSELFEKQPVK